MGNLFDLTGRVAVVCGGTSGLGQAIGKGLADHGAQVVASGRRAARYAADVTDRGSLDAMRDRVLADFGRVDILVYAAGVTFRKPTEAISEPEWARLFDTNLSGALRAAQCFRGELRSSGRGRMITVVSLGSFLAFHEVAAYCAAKSGLLSLTRSLACEWAADGIRVNAIAPGVFPTELNRDLILGTPRGQELLMRTPLRRFGAPQELVGAAVLLASDGASFLTGQCIAVDGGYLASGVNQ